MRIFVSNKTATLNSWFVKIITTFVFITLHTPGAAQNLSPRKQAQQNIRELKNGILLVRLSTAEHTVAAYLKINRDDLAADAAEKNLSKNKIIAQAFKNNFTFCPVYFFFSSFSKPISIGDYNKVVVLNYNLAPDTSIHLSTTNFFIAEFAKLESDTVRQWEYYTGTAIDSTGKRESRYAGGTGSNFSALVLKNKNFEQLRRPFPFYVKYHPMREQNKEINLRVNMLNKTLFDFYEN